MNKVLFHHNGEVTADCARRRLLGIGRSHQISHDFPRISRPFNDRDQRRTPRDERDQVGVEGLTLVFGVVALRGRHVDGTKFTRSHSKLFRLKTREYFSNETSFDPVGFDDNESSVHELRI